MEASTEQHKLIVSVSPHVQSGESAARIMWTVAICLLPALVMGGYYFGPKALWIVALCIGASMASEWLVERMAGREVTVGDGSAALTGLLLGLNMPPTAPFYIPLVTSFVAVGITKQLFGGLGFNIFNPALIGRAFALISWPRAMTTWIAPTASFTGMDAVSAATPLSYLKPGEGEGIGKLIEVAGGKAALYMDLFTGAGVTAGSIGETSAVAILIGAAYLFYKRYITWHIPMSFLATAGLLAWIFGGDGFFNGDPIVHLFSGGMMLGVFFMATDYVTAPNVRKAQVIFGVGCGALTMLIRLKGGYPEGVMFAILLMNCFAPMLDRKYRTKTFGERKEEVAK